MQSFTAYTFQNETKVKKVKRQSFLSYLLWISHPLYFVSSYPVSETFTKLISLLDMFHFMFLLKYGIPMTHDILKCVVISGKQSRIYPPPCSGHNSFLMPATAGDIKDTGSVPGSGRSPGEGNGNPLQYSCLENPMDRGTWRATVHGVAKSQTQLK